MAIGATKQIQEQHLQPALVGTGEARDGLGHDAAGSGHPAAAALFVGGSKGANSAVQTNFQHILEPLLQRLPRKASRF